MRGAVEGANVGIASGGTGKVRESGDAVRAGGGSGDGFGEFDPEGATPRKRGDGVAEVVGIGGTGVEVGDVVGRGGREVVDVEGAERIKTKCGDEGISEGANDGTLGNRHSADGTRRGPVGAVGRGSRGARGSSSTARGRSSSHLEQMGNLGEGLIRGRNVEATTGGTGSWGGMGRPLAFPPAASGRRRRSKGGASEGGLGRDSESEVRASLGCGESKQQKRSEARKPARARLCYHSGLCTRVGVVRASASEF